MFGNWTVILLKYTEILSNENVCIYKCVLCINWALTGESSSHM